MPKIIYNPFSEAETEAIYEPGLLLILNSSDCKLLLEELDHHTCKLSNYQPFHDLLKMLYEVVNETEETKDSSNG